MGESWPQRTAEVLAPLLATYYDNYNRILHLVRTYKDLYGSGAGRRAVHKGDILRSAVVFTHAALEALLRGLGCLYLHEAGPHALDSVPLTGHGEKLRAEKFFLGALVQHRGKTVDEVLSESVTDYLNQRSFNDTNEICALLASLGVAIEGPIKESLPELQKLIRRRHQIVHQADLTSDRGRGRQRAASISVKQVLKWLKATREFSIGVTSFVIDREYEKIHGMTLTERDELIAGLEARVRKIERLEKRVREPDASA